MHATETSAPEWEERLRAAGLRVTAGRVAALMYLEANPHRSASDIHTALHSELPSLSAQSVHNITNDLTAHSILRRIDLPDASSALFETRTADNHHHVQCVVCQHIVDVDCVVGEAPCLVPGGGHGMRVLEAAVTFRGVCAECESGLAPELADSSLSAR